MPERGAFGEGGVDDTKLALMRLDRMVRQRLEPAVVADSRELAIAAWRVGGEPVPFATARSAEFEPVEVGVAWGAPWDTVWFRVSGEVPAHWRAAGWEAELDVDLGIVSDYPGFQAEGLVYRPDGSIVKGVHPQNAWVPIVGERVDLYLEAAANPDVAGDFTFLPTPLGDRATAGEAPYYVLRRLRLVARDPEAWALVQDLRVLRGLALELPAASPRRADVLRALDGVVDAIDPDDVRASVPAARAVAAEALARPAHASAHRVLAVGHAHIDSAWLWPTRETVRKVARTFANALDLAERDPGFVFAASSAQHYDWLREGYPELFARVRDAVAAGRFVPVGGMWVESDTNLPSGESLVRQLVYGKRFFLEHFGVETEEVWLPDSFGYSAGLPQLIRASGSRWFLTQKISWNDTNRMPHHSFLWEGIDGSRVFTHFPPTDTYSSDLSIGELALAERQYREDGRANTSLALFGWGDGGGGPTREMLAAAHRSADLEGAPRVELASPRAFFERAEAEYVDPPVWTGEMYLELHRGVATTQARIKRGNRRSEALLREAELWSATATVRAGAPYPHAELDAAWRTVLLHQFHDILPGSSIAWVNQETERAAAENLADLESLVAAAQRALLGPGSTAVGFNAGPFARSGVAALGAGPVDESGFVRATADGDGVRFASPSVRARIDGDGLLVSLVDVATGRELIRAGEPGMLFQLFRDTPRQWDAWDIDRETLAAPLDLRRADAITIDDDGETLVIRRSTPNSTIEQRLRMRADDGALELRLAIDWHEREKLLKLAFPLDLRVDRATSEIAYGHVHRPVHENTSWDRARFETSGHRWLHVGEPGIGVAIANDVAYGHDVRPRTDERGRPLVVPRLSLLRGPLFPDPDADQGRHVFDLSVRVTRGLADAVDEGYRRHLPLRVVEGGAEGVEPLVRVDGAGVVVEALKLADDGSGDVVVRCYEALGTRTRATLHLGFASDAVVETDLLERPVPALRVVASSSAAVELDLPAFTIATLRIARPSTGGSSA